MFPEGLQRAKRPAETLADQRGGRFRRVGPAYGLFFIINFPAGAANRDGQVRIFGHRIGAEAAAFVDGFGAPCAQRAGDYRNAIQQVERALFQILTRDIFERLPTREPADSIPDFYVSGNRADAGIHKVPHEFRYRVRLDGGIRIDGDENAAGGFGQAVRERRGFPAIRLMNDAHCGIAPELLIEQLPGAVGRAVVNHEDFQFRVIGLEHRVYGVNDNRLPRYTQVSER